jgi:hypothetical protein
MKLIAKILFSIFFISCLINENHVSAQNKSAEKIPALPKLLSLREQMTVREAWLK